MFVSGHLKGDINMPLWPTSKPIVVMKEQAMMQQY